MRILTRSFGRRCTLLAVCCLLGTLAGADTSPVYDQVMEALEALPRDGGITVDFGVEEERYTEKFRLTEATLRLLHEAQAPQTVIDGLMAITNRDFASKEACTQAVEHAIGQEYAGLYEVLILNSAYQGSAAFAFGDSFEARFRADIDCYVALIHIGVDTKDAATGQMVGGDITVLLPNQHTPDARIQADRVYSTTEDFSIPLTVSPPQGYEVINILCSTEPFDLFAKTGPLYQGYAVITPTDDPALEYLVNGLRQAASGKFGGTSMVLQLGPGTRAALPKKFGKLKPMGGTGTTGKFFPPLEKP